MIKELKYAPGREIILSPLDDSFVDCAPGRCIKITTCRFNSTVLFFGLFFPKKSKKYVKPLYNKCLRFIIPWIPFMV